MQVKLERVHAAFTKNLFKASSIGDSDPKFRGTFVMEPKSEAAIAITKAMQKVASEKWGPDAKSVYTTMVKQDRLCLHDGDTKAKFTGFAGNVFVTANSDMRTEIVRRDGRTQVTEEDGLVHSGCIVDAIIDIWAQDDRKWGKRINAGLGPVRYVEPGENWSGIETPKASSVFEALPDEEDVNALFGDGPEDNSGSSTDWGDD